jgi:AraC-like DNA-binding protein
MPARESLARSSLLGGLDRLSFVGLGVSSAPRLHATWAIGLVVDGRVEVRLAHHRAVVRRGQGFAIRPCEVYAVQSDPREWSDIAVFVTSHPGDASGDDDQAFVTTPLSADVFQQLSLLTRDLQHPGGSTVLQTVLDAACASVRPGLFAPRPLCRRASWKVRRARAHLREHFRARFNLAVLAEVSESSPYHLVRMFHAAFGLPPRAYVEQLRIAAAQPLIASGERVAETGHRLGFVDQPHFTRVFKRVVSLTPGAYATLCRESVRRCSSPASPVSSSCPEFPW